MSPTPTHKGHRHQLDEQAAADILMRRARKKIPTFHPLDELSLIPYLDVMVNLIIFMLVTISSYLPLGILSIFPPGQNQGAAEVEKQPEEPKKEQLTLTVFITRDGYTIAGIGGVLPPITNKGDAYDYDGLSNKAAEIKDSYPSERQVIIAAEQDIKYDILIKTMDALRSKGERVLFDSVKLSPGFKS